ncbi:MAG: glycosyltransferase family 2 protein [Thiogranum sp.]
MPDFCKTTPWQSPIQSSAATSLSVVVPCYNEEQVLPELHKRLAGACKEVAAEDFQIVLVDDGSVDSTWDLISELAQQDPRVTGVRLSRNYGHQLALAAGMSWCTGSRVLVIDADLQDPPELLAPMMKLMDEGADVVYGQRAERLGETRFKKATASLFYRFLERLTDIPIPRDSGDFRLMSRRVVDLINSMPEQHRFVRGMVSWVGFRQVPLLYERKERVAGSTKYPFRKMLNFSIDAITGFSVTPLRIASGLGMLFGVIGLLGLIYAFGSWVAGVAVPGWTSVVFIVLILGSVQLLVLGIFGEYLGRLYMESKQRPLFVIDQVTGPAHHEESD